MVKEDTADGQKLDGAADPVGGSETDQAHYRVRLTAFEGPLDLLLHLIRRAEVDVHDIPVAQIADEYMRCLEGLIDKQERIDIELAGEFLVMAATLMEIKSRMIQPVEERPDADDSDEQGEDPRAELVRQLLEYKKYRDASDQLDARRLEWDRRYPAGRAPVDRQSMADAVEGMDTVELDEIEINDLVAAFERIVESVNFERLGEHEVVDDDTPIELHAEDILDRVQRDGFTVSDPERGESPKRLTLQKVFEGRSRAAMLGLFLALLELLKQQRAVAKQDRDLGEIVVELKAVKAESPESAEPGQEA